MREGGSAVKGNKDCVLYVRRMGIVAVGESQVGERERGYDIRRQIACHC